MMDNCNHRCITKMGIRFNGRLYLPNGLSPGTEILVQADPNDDDQINLFDPETKAFLGVAHYADIKIIRAVVYERRRPNLSHVFSTLMMVTPC